MGRLLWVALVIGCSGNDKDTVAVDDTHTDTTVAVDTDGTGADTDEPVGDTDVTPAETDTPTGPQCLAVDPTAPVVPLLPAVGIELEGRKVLYGMPDAEPRAIILYFHGSGGSAGDFGGTEEQALMNQLVPFGWGFIAAESEDQDPGNQWNTSHDADNPDMARVLRAVEHVAGITSLEADTPIVAMGFSNGGQAVAAFVDIYGDDLPIVGASFHNTSGWGIEDVPTIWFATENDSEATPAQLEASHEEVLADGRISEYYLQPEQLITTGMLQRNPAIDAYEAADLIADMVAGGLIAEDGSRLVQGDGDALDKALNNWSSQSAVPGALRASDQAHAIWALHRFNGYQADVECEFLTGLVGAP